MCRPRLAVRGIAWPRTHGVYDNLYLAGDWTRTRFCGGCVENAVQSGLAAARAISGRPDLGGADAGAKECVVAVTALAKPPRRA